MRHHQHKGLYIALKLGGAAVATAAATAAVYKAYVVLKEKSKQQEMLAEASLHHGDSGRLHRLNQQYDRQSASSNFHNFGGVWLAMLSTAQSMRPAANSVAACTPPLNGT